MKLSILFIISIFFFLNLNSLELTQNEINYLNEKQFFTVLVTNNNYPYEYINENGVISGINIEFINEILKFSGLQINYITDFSEDQKIDLISSFYNNSNNSELNTHSIYKSEINFIQNVKITDYNNIDNFIIVNQENIILLLNNSYPGTKYIFFNNLKKAIFYYNKNNKNSILVVDSFNINKVKEILDSVNLSNLIINTDLTLDFYLQITNNNRNLYSIITKSIQKLYSNNQFYHAFAKYQQQSYNELLLFKYQNIILIVLTIILLLLVLCIYLLFRFKVFQFRIEKLINNYKNENVKLSLEIENMTYQLETINIKNKHILDNINNLAFVLDLKGNFLYINNFCKKIINYDKEYLIGHNIDEILSPEHKQKLLNISSQNYDMNKLISDQQNSNPYEIEIISKDGLKKNFIFSTHFTKSLKGETEINCILQDISDRKSLENRLEAYTNHLEDLVKQRTKTLKESEERFKFVIEKAYDGIFMVQNYVFSLVNEAFCVMTGYSKNKFYEKVIKFSDIIDSKERNSIISKIQDFIDKKIGYFILHTKIIKYNGDPCDVEIHFTTINTEGEDIILGVIHDIAEKKEHENKKLQAERINIISSFAITANDRINSPLNAIQGYVELLELQNKNPEPVQIKAFENIYDSISIIKTILNRLRSLTHVTLEKYNLDDLNMIDITKEFESNKENQNEQ